MSQPKSNTDAKSNTGAESNTGTGSNTDAELNTGAGSVADEQSELQPEPTKTMRAAFYDRYCAGEELEVRTVATPVAGDGEVLLAVQAACINPADWHFMTGTPYVARIEFGLRSPKRNIPGSDVAGRVVAVGTGVERLNVGDEVFGYNGGGCLAQYVAVPEEQLLLRPDDVTPDQAATLGVAAFTALYGLRTKGHLEAGQKVLITGASGGVGTFAVQIAKSFGAEVTAVCSSKHVEMVRSLGADRVIDYTSEDFLADTDHYDLMFDIVGLWPLSRCRAVLKQSGRLLLVSGPKKNRLLGPVTKAVRAMIMSRFVSQSMAVFVAEETPEDLAILRDLVVSGQLKPVVGCRYPLEEVSTAMAHQGEGHVRGKIVVNP